MKFITLILMIFLSARCYSQKINSYTYKKVDSLIQFKDAEVIIYKDKAGKQKRDTVYFSKMKRDIRIEYIDVMQVDDIKKIQNY